MQDIIDQLLSYLKGIWIRKWLVLLIAWAICLVGWPVVLKMPDQYEARAQVYVDTDSLLKPLLRGIALQTNPTQQIGMMVRTLMTRPNLEKIARLTDLDLTTNTPREFDTLINKLKSDIKLKRAGRENLYTIAYASDDPVLAKNVVQSTLTTLVENTLGDKREDSDTAQGFLDQQIEEYERRINETENQLKEFQRRNVGLMPGEQGGYYSRLQGLKLELGTVELQLKESQTRYESIRRQMDGEEPSFGLIESPVSSGQFASKFDSRIEALESNLDQLRLKYTDAHPDIKEIQRTIQGLETKREKELAEYKDAQQSATGNSFNGLDQNPVFQELKLSLAREGSNVETLKVRAQNYRNRVAELEKKIHTIPEIEAELKALQRGHSINQQKYNELTSRREAVQISQKAEVSSDSFQFRVIDPPRVPTKPTGPNRPLFLSAVLFVAIGAGIGLAFVVSQLRPVFFSTKQLNSVTGIPVLGSVTMLHSQQVIQATRRRGFTFLLVGFALISLYAVILGIQLNPELNSRLLAYIPDIPSKVNSLVPALEPIIDKLKSLL